MTRPQCGIGWRHPHYTQLLQELPPLGFIEVHSENFFADGGAALATLVQARASYAVSLHGVGLGLGSAAGIDNWHLERLARLVERIDPLRVSDHACFTTASLNTPQGTSLVHGMDLLPIPFTATALDVMSTNVQRVQDRLQRPILVENLSAYLAFDCSDIPEQAFLAQLVKRTGCQLLLDVNNLYVNALNAKVPDPVGYCGAWMQSIPVDAVGEIHLAGHCTLTDMVIDDHGSSVCDGVWAVYTQALARFGHSVPSLVEWDTDLPALGGLLAEAAHADALRAKAMHAQDA